MHFSNNINFQYFFFDTYPGYFLQALPFALIGGAVLCGISKQEQNTDLCPQHHSALPVCQLYDRAFVPHPFGTNYQ